jgi:hypothetical protein
MSTPRVSGASKKLPSYQITSNGEDACQNHGWGAVFAARCNMKLTALHSLNSSVIAGTVSALQRSAGLPVLVVRATDFSFKGEIKPYTKIGGSGMPTTRNFCARCSSLLFGTPHHAPGIVTVYAGTLDDPSQFKPEFVQFASERHQLDGHRPDIPRHLRRAPDQ